MDTKTVRVWVDDEYLEFEIDVDGDISEDILHETVVDYVLSNVQIEIF